MRQVNDFLVLSKQLAKINKLKTAINEEKRLTQTGCQTYLKRGFGKSVEFSEVRHELHTCNDVSTLERLYSYILDI